MRGLWNAVSFIAIVNLLAMLMFAGWLWQSGRIDRHRILNVRDTFSLPIAEVEAAEAKAQTLAEAERQEAAELARELNPPLPSAQQVNETLLMEAQTAQAIRRLHDETSGLLAQLNTRSQQLDRREVALATKKQQWMDSIEEERQRRTDEQFSKTVKQYESAPPKIAKQWILKLVDSGEKDQVVAYLDAMNARIASKILREFKTEQEAALATELLEELRMFGLEAGDLEDSSDDETRADAD